MLKNAAPQSRPHLSANWTYVITPCRKYYKRKTGRTNCDTFSAKLQWKE